MNSTFSAELATSARLRAYSTSANFRVSAAELIFAFVSEFHDFNLFLGGGFSSSDSDGTSATSVDCLNSFIVLSNFLKFELSLLESLPTLLLVSLPEAGDEKSSKSLGPSNSCSKNKSSTSSGTYSSLCRPLAISNSPK